MFEADRNTNKVSHLYHHIHISELQVMSAQRTMCIIFELLTTATWCLRILFESCKIF